MMGRSLEIVIDTIVRKEFPTSLYLVIFGVALEATYEVNFKAELFTTTVLFFYGHFGFEAGSPR